VHHGVPADLLPFSSRDSGYLAFVGRISPEKRVDRAIAIAQRAGLPLKIAAKVDAADKPYFASDIEPLLHAEGVEYLGEIGEIEKGRLLGGARALLFPIDWPEPFGMVVIEALACGTPVVAWGVGSVPELIEHGTTGFVVDSIDRAAAAVRAAEGIDRHGCRRSFERRFTATRMARDYELIYTRLIECHMTRTGEEATA
jgi:glycosyltransferase involved in cell wall biosynthesis